MHRTLTQVNNIEQKVFWLLVLLAGSLALAYVYLVNATIINVVARKQAYESISSISADVASMESRYVALSNNITLERAHQLGFVDAGTNTSFVYLGGHGGVSMR